jgi:dolichyl-phosphooligosaccharide-protein glycotransferase
MIIISYGRTANKNKHLFQRSKMEDDKKLSKQDLIKLWAFISSYKKFAWILLVIIPLLVSVHLRMEPARLNVAEDWAINSVDRELGSAIRADIAGQNPHLTDDILNQEVQKDLESYRGSAEYDQQVSALTKQYKSLLQDDDGTTYLLAIDPYYWMRHAKNVINHGTPADEIKEGRWYDSYMYAPVGRFMSTDMFHAYFIAWVYFLTNALLGWSLMKATFITPVILVSAACIPAFFIARRVGGNVAGFVAALWIAINPALMSRTAGGFADTDPYTVLMPLLITWLFLEAYYMKNKYLKIGLAILSGLALGLFGFAWIGWSFVFDVMVCMIIAYAGYLLLMKLYFKRDTISKLFNHGLISGAFLISSFIFLSLFRDIKLITQAILGPIWFYKLKEVAVAKIWPNVLTTVAEQNEINLSTIVNYIGGEVAVALAIVGIIVLGYKKNIKYLLWTLLFIAATTFAGTRGIRYVQLMLPAIGLAVGIGLGFIYTWIVDSLNKWMGLKRLYVIPVVFCLVLVVIIPTYNSVASVAENEIPSFDDSWFHTLNKIKLESSKDAIITSWWDFGHWFKMMGDRAVTFDGTSQDSPQAHWVGKALQTHNENESVAILRMLACGGNGAYEYLTNVKGLNKLEAKLWLDDFILFDKSNAEWVAVQNNYEIIEFTHCDPPEVYLITSNDMIGKAGVWAHFGLWDFTKAQIYQDVVLKKKTSAYPDLADSELVRLRYEASSLYGASDANNWISPWPSYMTNFKACTNNNMTVDCMNDLGGGPILFRYNKTNQSLDFPLRTPNTLIYVENQTFNEIDLQGDLGASLIISPEHGNMFVSPELDSSMFTRLYFLGGAGLSHFDLFTRKQSPVGWDIIVWKVKFNDG